MSGTRLRHVTRMVLRVLDFLQEDLFDGLRVQLGTWRVEEPDLPGQPSVTAPIIPERCCPSALSAPSAGPVGAVL